MRVGVGALCVVGMLLVAPVLAAPDFEALGRTVVEELAAKAFDKTAARFDVTMAAAMPQEKLAQTWNAVVDQVGAFKSITSVRLQPVAAQKVTVALMTSVFEKATLVVQVAFRDDEKIVGLFFRPAPATPTAEWNPPSYVDRASFIDKSVTVGPFQLPATLSMPNGTGPVAAVVLVHGSGPNDRDETIGPNRIFKDLAEGLASRHIAVLRYEKRTFAPGRGRVPSVKEETLDDAKAAVTLVGTDPRVDRGRIFVVGHSLGGTLAPRIAAADPRVAGIIVLAGASRPMEVLAVEQVAFLTGSKSPETAAVEEAARQVQSPDLKPDTIVNFLGAPTPGSYWLDLRSYRPVETAQSLSIPMMFLQGGRDYQVTSVDFEGWKKVLGARSDVTFKPYPDANHLFMDGAGTPNPAEYLRPGHMDGDVVADIADWITSRDESR